MAKTLTKAVLVVGACLVATLAALPPLCSAAPGDPTAKQGEVAVAEGRTFFDLEPEVKGGFKFV